MQSTLLNKNQLEIKHILNVFSADVSIVSAATDSKVKKRKLQDSDVEKSVIESYDFMKTETAHEQLGKTKGDLIFPLIPLRSD